MLEPRRILTLHSPVPPAVLDRLLTAVDTALRDVGADRVWIDPCYSPDLVVMAELDVTSRGLDAFADVTAVMAQPH